LDIISKTTTFAKTRLEKIAGKVNQIKGLTAVPGDFLSEIAGIFTQAIYLLKILMYVSVFRNEQRNERTTQWQNRK